ncbi:MAG: replication restart helicase PriA [bacterium]
MPQSERWVDILIIKRSLILTYCIPEHKKIQDYLGRLVVVPLRKEKLLGCVIRKSDPGQLKNILDVESIICPEVFLSPLSLKLAQFISNYYACSLSKTLEKIFPGGSYTVVRRQLKVVKEIPEKYLNASPSLTRLNSRKELNYLTVKKNLSREHNLDLLAKLINEKYLTSHYFIPPPQKSVFSTRLITLTSKIQQYLSPRQIRLLEILALHQGTLPLDKLITLIGPKVVDTVIQLARRRIIRISRIPATLPPSDFQLTPEQKAVVEKIINLYTPDQFLPILLHGITGSGKTLVYKKIMEKVLSLHKKVLVLVPEIGLIQQTVNYFRAAFPQYHIGFYHSSLSSRIRFDQYRLAAQTKIDIIIGTRSAIFIPLEPLGLVVVDEEHSRQYKEQESPPLYSARDLAVVKAKYHRCPVILGSATPSAESYLNAQQGKYIYTQLTKRVKNARLPSCFITPIEPQAKLSLTPGLIENLEQCGKQQRQAILLINRRGYANFVICPSCGEVINCPQCQVTMTYHRSIDKLICHYCNYQKKIPAKCPHCENNRLHIHGWGTQKVEQQLKQLLPQRIIVRLDTDVLKRKKMTHAEVFNEFQRYNTSILLGTQMVSKGLDFPGVSLVGIIDADEALSFPDFRCGEYTFQLLVQAAGRSGREDQKGKVIIQTRNPRHPVILHASKHDYISFISQELNMRKAANYPPYSKLIRIIIKSTNLNLVKQTANKFKILIEKKIGGKYELLGPSPAPLEKIKRYHRWHLLIKTDKTDHLGVRLLNLKESINSSKISIIIDVDPQWMM